MTNNTLRDELTRLDNTTKEKSGAGAVFICESAADWQALMLAEYDPFFLNPENNPEQLNGPEKVLEMLQMKERQKAIIVCPSTKESFNIWQAVIRTARETTTADIDTIPAEIRKKINLISQDPMSPSASKAIRKLKAYRAAVEESKNPRPGNIEDYFNSGAYEQDLKQFTQGANIPTGFSDLDLNLGGGLFSGLYVIGATPGLGKTTFCLQVADQIAETRRPVMFFSLEQSRLELVTKSISRTARKINPSNQRELKNSLQIRRGYTSAATADALQKYRETVAPYMHIIQGNFETNVDTIRATVQRFIERNKIRPVVIIDYLQIIRPGKASRARDTRAAVDEVLTELKRMSRDFEIPVICISTLNRTNYSKTMGLESFKESGGVEYTADVAIGMQYEIISALDGKNENADREKVNEEKNKAEREIVLICLKNRYGKGYFQIKYKYYPVFDYFIEKPQHNKIRTDNWFSNVPTL